MGRLIIAGAGAFAREVLIWANDIQNKKKVWDEIGFIDDTKMDLLEYGISNKIVSTIIGYRPCPEDSLVCAIGDTKGKMKVYQYLKGIGGKFTNLIHPSAIVSDQAILGNGVILSPFTIVSSNVTIGDCVTLNSYSAVGHDSMVKTGCTISAHCNVMGNVVLEEGVFLGGSAVIIPKITIQKDAVVGAGSVVIRNVREGITVFGNPAVKIN